MQTLLSKLLQQPDFYAKRVMQWELGLFVFGALLCMLFPAKEGHFIVWYFGICMVFTLLASLVGIVLLFIKRPRLYLLYVLFIILLPIPLTMLSAFLIMASSGITC